MARLRRLAQLRAYEDCLDAAGLGPVAGVDEAGRGACAGPLTVAACVLPNRPIRALAGIDDSKRLTPRRREELYEVIVDCAEAWAVVSYDAAEIDARGIQSINLEGMRVAVARLYPRPGYVLTDAWRVPSLRQPHLPMIGGDGTARCIAAASILAKVTRDRIMVDLDGRYPGYGLANHKGYSTQKHVAAVRHHGASPVHRYTYANVRRAHEEWLGQRVDDHPRVADRITTDEKEHNGER